MIIDPGKRAEYLLAHQALNYNLMVLWPSSETTPYDLAIDANGDFIKVQVKATYTKYTYRNRDTYRINVTRSNDAAYEDGDFDVLAVYVQPHNVWYLIPYEMIKGKKELQFNPHREDVGKYEHYRDAWHVLKGK
jgi:hypothetical protein